MEGIEFPGAVPLAGMGHIVTAMSRGNSDFLATLLAMAGHDLRQPLQLITNALDVLRHTLADEEQREELTRAAEATAQLAGMLGQLVEALQLHERPNGDLHLPVSLRPVLDDLAAEFAEAARLKGISLVVTAADGTALSHPVLLTGILRNLIRNAIDYTPGGGGVWITCRQDGPELRISVRDNGAGIRANTLATIFRAFERADDSRTDGLGLGLYIVKNAAGLLGHRVEVRSSEGHGSCFTVVTKVARSDGGQKMTRGKIGLAEPNSTPAMRPIPEGLSASQRVRNGRPCHDASRWLCPSRWSNRRRAASTSVR